MECEGELVSGAEARSVVGLDVRAEADLSQRQKQRQRQEQKQSLRDDNQNGKAKGRGKGRSRFLPFGKLRVGMESQKGKGQGVLWVRG